MGDGSKRKLDPATEAQANTCGCERAERCSVGTWSKIEAPPDNPDGACVRNSFLNYFSQNSMNSGYR
jgi:hypothetical protein